MTDTSELIPEDGWIRRYIDLYTPMSEAPAEAHLAVALAVLSAAVGWRAYVKWGESAEPANLFVMLEGTSATAKKTTTAKTGTMLVDFAVSVMPKDLVDTPLRVRTISHTSRRGLLELVGTPDEAKAKRWDVEPPPGVLLDWDEFGAVLGRPGDTKNSDYLGHVRACMMELYGGRHGGIQTGELKYRAARCAVSVIATMTRHELEQRVSLGLLSDGFMGRFVLIPHPGRRAYLSEPPPPDDLYRAERDWLARFLAKVATSKQEVGSIFGRMEKEAHEHRREWYERRMRELDKAAKGGTELEQALSDAMGRLQTTAVKVAGILAVSRMDDDEDLGELIVSEEDVAAGIAFAEHALSEVASLAGDGGGLPTDRYGRRIVDYVRSLNGQLPVSRKQLMSAVRADGLDAAARWRVVERLHEEGHIEIIITRTGGRPLTEVTL